VGIEKRVIRSEDNTRAARKALANRSSSFKLSKGQARAAAARAVRKAG
jgi:hypothetical protein